MKTIVFSCILISIAFSFECKYPEPSHAALCKHYKEQHRKDVISFYKYKEYAEPIKDQYFKIMSDSYSRLDMNCHIYCESAVQEK